MLNPETIDLAITFGKIIAAGIGLVAINDGILALRKRIARKRNLRRRLIHL
jgi:hypothetical protein